MNEGKAEQEDEGMKSKVQSKIAKIMVFCLRAVLPSIVGWWRAVGPKECKQKNYI
jgi:hypothetical protein